MPVKSTLERILPAPVFRQLIDESQAHFLHWPSWLRNRNRFRGKTGLRVNLGCGPNIIDGWINIDLYNDRRVICWDCRRKLPFDSGAVSAIFAEHMFEHLYHPQETMPFLKECRRCLAPQGVLRIIVPNAGKYLHMYGDWEGLALTRPLEKRNGAYYDPWLHCSYATQMEMINAIFRQGTHHKYAWDAETLLKAMSSAGFARVIEQSFGISISGVPLDSEARKSESLYVEAVN